jgi:predicted ATPase/class 3 adenylate cyclase
MPGAAVDRPAGPSGDGDTPGSPQDANAAPARKIRTMDNTLRALLLTDVVDSTKLSEQLGDASMATVWAAHDRVARDLLPAWRGREIDKTDGMLLMFDSAADAVGYAMAYHRAIGALPVPLKARAGLHVGPVILRENSAADVALGAKPLEVDGLAKPTAARVMSLAQGGQTLLTADARAALGPTTLRVQSHGHWVMKGVAEPVELFEAGDADTPFAPPPDGDKVHRVVRSGERWLPVRQIPNNLPQQVNSFLGREQEIVEVKALLGRARLLTLLGMGGLGKTRLSLQVAAEVMPLYPDGVWFLDLAPIRDPALVVSEAAQVLDVREEPGRPLLQTLCAQLKSRRVLLIIDNCEHLIKASAELANAILRAAPQVQMLASSREALHVAGEQVVPVLPLPLPRRGDGIDALARSAAVRLFVERAQQHRPAFVLNERDAPAVAELVARLEGIPLALELAAARMRSLPVADINARLKDRYKLLTGGGRVLLERQQTLRALVDWSYDLLDESEQTVLNRLSLFAGGFDLAAAEAVCGAEPLVVEDVLDALGSLVEKSLVMLDESEEAARYRMLETKLEQAGGAAAAAARHCDHYFVLAKTANRGLAGAEQAEWIWRFETEFDNIRAAIALALAGGVDRVIAVKLAVAMQGFWMLRGYATEGRGVVRAALALPEVQASDRAHANALYVGAALAESQGDYVQARQMLEHCLQLHRGLGDEYDIAATLSTLSMARLPSGDVLGARENELEALAMFRKIGEKVGEVIGLLHLGQIDAYAGEDERARETFLECLALSRAIKNQEVEGECELMLAELAFESGDAVQARALFQHSLTVCREAGDKRGEARAMRWLGKADLVDGDLASARRRLEEALRSFRAFESREELLGCLEDRATLAAAEGRPELAVQLAAAVESARERLALKRPPRWAPPWKTLVEQLRAEVAPAAFDQAWAAGARWEIEDAVEGAMTPAAPPVAA